MNRGPPGVDRPPDSSLKIPPGGPEHWSAGTAGDSIIYLNDNGEWVKINKRGALYLVDERGYRRVTGSTRPPKYTPKEWQRLPHEVRKSIAKAAEKEDEAAKEKKKADDKVKESEAKSKAREEKKRAKAEKKEKKKDDDDPKAGVAKDYGHVRRGQVIQYGKDRSFPHGKERISNIWISPTQMYLMMMTSSWNGMNGLRSRKEEDPWLIGITTMFFDTDQCKVVVSAPPISSENNGIVFKPPKANCHAFPCMPCINQCDEHREKIQQNTSGININNMFSTAVARPVARKEMMENDEARRAMRKEWLGQHEAGVYDFSVVREYDDVVREAKQTGNEVHMARIHGICVEKNFQLPQGHPNRKFKGRGVLLGNQVKNQFWEAAFFQDLGNSPATFEASRWADFYGCLPGHGVKLADAVQAYIQAILPGPPCWVELPEDAWPDNMDFRKFRRPVVRLIKALYGHPDSGTMWEQHCDRKVRELGFIPVGEEWPSMYFHKKLQLLLVVYVDDLKLAGPEENLTKQWEVLRSKLNIEPETDLGLYLGCVLSKGSAKLNDGTPVCTMTYDMECLVKLSVERYLEIVGKDTKLKHVSTP